jgi:hypothetical protein
LAARIAALSVSFFAGSVASSHAVPLADRLEDLVQVPLVHLRAGDEGGDLLLLLHLPVDVFLDIGVVGIDDDHLGRAPRGAARLDRARRAVADLEEAHEARGLAAARELLALAAEAREVGAGARAVLEEPRLADPEVHDAAFVHQIVGDGLDEAGMRLRMLVGAFGLRELAGAVVDVEVALGGTVDPVGPVQAGVEPLRRVRRRALGGEHVAHLVEIGAGVLLGREVAALPAPVGPGAREPVEDLARGGLAREALAFGQFGQRRLVGDGPPEELGDSLLADLLQRTGTPALRKYFCAMTSEATWLQPSAPRSLRAGRRPCRPGCGSPTPWW